MNIVYILCVETSADLCSVAISTNGEKNASCTFNETKSHAQKILILIEQLLKSVNLKLDNLNAIAISSGPGSYTGLRIGYAVAKGLCSAIGIPLLEINTLFSMALSVILMRPHYDYYIPMLDARRMEVYSMVVDLNGDIVEDQKPTMLDHHSFTYLGKSCKVIAFGSGTAKLLPISSQRQNWFTLPDIIPDANYLIKQSYNKYLKNDFSPINSCAPIYLKTFSNPEL